MANIMDYVAWRGDLSFRKSCVNEVDVVILSQIVMMDLRSCVPTHGAVQLSDCAKSYFMLKPEEPHIGFIIPETINDLFDAMAHSVRFSGLLLSNYIEDIDKDVETQFSALTVDAPDVHTRFVVFSGTDDTIVGWKENFNLIYKTPTNAQLQSVKYLNAAARDYHGKIVVLGHSKGGHLAIYAAANSEVETRRMITGVFNMDGPGFPEDDKQTRLFATVERRVVTLLPQSSIIGKLFSHGERNRIVHSTAKGLFQHDCFSWQVMGTQFLEESKFTKEAVALETGLKSILADMKLEERETCVEAIFALLYRTKCNTLTELAASGVEFVRAYMSLPSEQKSAVNRVVKTFMHDKYLRKNILETSAVLTKMSMSNKEVKKLKQMKSEKE